MGQAQFLKRRIRSVKNAKQLTKALEVVAASRMRKVQEAVERSRAYGDIADSIMRRVAPSQEAKHHPYFAPAANKSSLYVVFSSDRGQAGAYNTNVFHLTLKLLREEHAGGGKPKMIIFGRKGASFFSHVGSVQLIGEYQDIADIPEVDVFAPVLDTIKLGFDAGDFGQVVIVYTQFVSSLNHKAANFQLLPVAMPVTEAGHPESVPADKVYEFEPEVGTVLEEALRLYFEAKLMQTRIESVTSEHAMRMIAMGSATRNASDLIDDLTLELNATRQAAITQEIAEITGGAAAIAA